MPLTPALLACALVLLPPDVPSTTAGSGLDLARVNPQRLDLPADPVESLTVDVGLDGRTYALALTRHSIRHDAFLVSAVDARGTIVPVAAPPARTYRGVITGASAGVVVGSLRDGRLYATARLDDGTIFHVQPRPTPDERANPEQHIVYRDGAIAPTPGRCGAGGTAGISDLLDLSAGAGAGARSGPPLELRIAFDADFEFFVLNQSSVDRTIFDIELVMNGVNAIYEAEAGITFPISGIVVRTAEPDPYTSSQSGTLLMEFTSTWNEECPAPRELGHLFTGKDLQGGVVGQAFIGTVCEDPAGQYSLAYALSQSRFSNVLAERVAVTAHEIGHNLGATHCENHKSCGIMCGIIGFCPIDTLGEFSVAQILAGIEPCICPADIDDDGRIGVSDLLLILQAWGPCNGSCPADADNDCVVGFTDLLLFLATFGSDCPGGA